MSEDGDKTEEPTEHKLQESRKKGQVFKSQEVVSTVMLAVSTGVLMTQGGWMFHEILVYSLGLWGNMDSYLRMENRTVFLEMLNTVGLYGRVLAPLMIACFFAAIIVNLAQVQFIFSTESLKPSLSKINPIAGFKKIFSMKSLMEVAKQIMKLGLIGYIVYSAVKDQIPQLVQLVGVSIDATVHSTEDICIQIIKKVIIGMIVISGIDFIFQKKQYMKEMKMSMQELKDEYKDTEGNPQVKAKLRQMMRQSGQQAMSEGVPQSTAVVTNPTHFAVAIRYEPGTDQAPMVTAKGEHLIAQQIKVLAEDNDIPIIENVELARALFGACEVGQPIPPDLYKATAEILAYVFKLKKKKMARQKRARAGAKKRVAGGR